MHVHLNVKVGEELPLYASYIHPRRAQMSSTILLVVVQTTTPLSLPPLPLLSLSCSSLYHLSILLLDSTYVQS